MWRIIFFALCFITFWQQSAYPQNITDLFFVSDTTNIEVTSNQTAKDSIDKLDKPYVPAVPLTQGLKQARDEIPWFSVAKIFWAIVVFFVAMIVIKYMIVSPLEAIAEHRPNLRLAIKRTVPIIQVFWWAFTIYLIIKWFFDFSSLIAFSASAGIAIGFASQDILKNIFGGIMILFDRPFQVGDKIEVGNYYGEVVQIGLRTVRIVTPDDSVVSIPNAEIMNQSVSNANSGNPDCQVVAEFYLPANIDVAKAKKIAYRSAAVSRYVYLNKPIAVILKNEIHYGKVLLKMRLKAYVLDIRYEFPFASEMTETVISEFIKQGLVTSEYVS